MFKKVYIEITNVCNLKCSFCIGNKREKKFMSIDEFQRILKKLDGVTKYLYLHILGEPLLHPNINKLIDIAAENFYVNITTNGYLIKNIKDNKNIRQLNISLHSFNPINNKSLEDYLNDIFECVDKLENTYINYRIWVDSPYKDEILNILEEKYNVKIEGNSKLKERVFIDFNESFIWPDLDNKIDNDGFCRGLIDHFGVLVDGSIVPCCLDSLGVITLGNIFDDTKTIEEILNFPRVKKMQSDFRNGKRCEELCRHCGFKIKKT
jgi:organic radical activating enzyme